jgi:hypothetical protein
LFDLISVFNFFPKENKTNGISLSVRMVETRWLKSKMSGGGEMQEIPNGSCELRAVSSFIDLVFAACR